VRRALRGTAVLALAALAGCGADAGTDGDAELTIFVSAPLSGPARAEGQAIAAGARRALGDADGRAGGVAVVARFLDVAGRNESRFDPVTAAANARRASERSTTIAYIGELDSGATRASLPITNSAGILQVAPGSGARDLVVDEPFDDGVPSEFQGTGERTYAQLGASYEPGERRPRLHPEALGYEAMASVLAAIDRAGDPLDRDSVIDAYFDGSVRESRLGSYRITETGEFEPVD